MRCLYARLCGVEIPLLFIGLFSPLVLESMDESTDG